MGVIEAEGNRVYREFSTDGVLASGKHSPKKAELRALFKTVDLAVYAAQAGIAIVADTTARDTFFATPANQSKLVYVNNNNGADDDEANGVYEYVGGAPRIATGYYQGLASVVQPLVDEATAAASAFTAQAQLTNLYYESFNLLTAGGLLDYRGYPLLGTAFLDEAGYPAAALSIIEPPLQSPFPTKTIHVPANAFNCTHLMHFADLKAVEGDTRHFRIGYVAQQIVLTEFRVLDAEENILLSELEQVDCRDPGDLSRGHNVLEFTLEIDATLAADAHELRIIHFVGAGNKTAAGGADITCISAADRVHQLSTYSIALETAKTQKELASGVAGERVLWQGDSLSEGDGVNQLSDFVFQDTSVEHYEAGIGGTSISRHVTPAYDALGPENVLRAIISGDWTDVDAAVATLDNDLGDDNSYIITPLKAVDLDGIDVIEAAFGRNDIVQDTPLGAADPRVTMSIASPGVVSWPGHELPVGAPVRFKTNGALPTGIAGDTVYFVQSVPDADTFTIAATAGGAAIDTSGSQSGVHRAYSRATWRSSIESYIDVALTANPSLQMRFISPMFASRMFGAAGTEDVNLVPNNAGILTAEYVDAMIDQAGRHGFPVFDALRRGGINMANAGQLLEDAVHLRISNNHIGERHMAARIKGWHASLGR